MNDHPHRGGFTLVEVLVSLGVLALLCAVLLPVTLSAREKARQSGCLSGLRQVGQAMLSYTTDNDGLYPPALTPEPDGTGSFTWAAVIAGPMPPRRRPARRGR